MQTQQTNGRLALHVAALAWPAVVESMLSMLTQYVDAAMVGSLGARATAAVAINASPNWLVNGLISMMSVGGTVVVARLIGAKEDREASVVARHTVVMGMLVGLALSLIAVVFAWKIPALMGAEADVLPDAGRYLVTVGGAIMFQALSLCLSGVIRGSGDTRTPMIVYMGSNLVNVCLNYLLIYPAHTARLGPFSFHVWGAGWGVFGAALATAASIALGATVLCAVFFARPSRIKFQVRELPHIRRDVVSRILAVGWPAAGERLTINIGQLIFTRMIAGLGTVAVAANYLAITAESICYMPAMGFQVAATTLVGQALGAGDTLRAEKNGWMAYFMGLAFMTVACGTLFVFPGPIMRIFSSDARVIEMGAMCLRIVAVAQMGAVANSVLAGALRGAGDTRAPMLINLACMWGLRLTLAYPVAYGLGWGLTGAWLCMGLDLAMRGVLTLIRFKSGKWKGIRV